MMNVIVERVTEAIARRSQESRRRYLEKIARAADRGKGRANMGCSNLAHGMAACSPEAKSLMQSDAAINLGIVTAYNDMLSAHQPYAGYPDQIRAVAHQNKATAQVAGGVPAMCDGVTQGEDGMDLSLFSRDTIAMSTAIALSHNLFDAVICLGICDKIVPGLMIGALSFGHLPTLFIPAGPMPSGLPNSEKAKVREAFAAGEVGRPQLIAAESAAYHAPGTCTFYGTANSNQMLMEFMGLQLPGGSFVNPDTELRSALTAEATRQVIELAKSQDSAVSLGAIVSEKTLVNAMVGLLATGGSTNHTLHLVAIARAAGLVINWSDFAELSAVVPLLARVYPNGTADVNHFHQAGGLGFIIRELLDAGMLHDDVHTVAGPGLRRFSQSPVEVNHELRWQPVASQSEDRNVVSGCDQPFQQTGGLSLVEGNLGRAIVKVSAVAEENRRIRAPARVFQSQEAFLAAFEAGTLNQDVVVVVSHQGPKSNGMPELHKLTPYLGILQNKGFKVALVTDGRMSGASGKVLAAIHVTPEACAEGPISQIENGDIVIIDAELGLLEVEAELANRDFKITDSSEHESGMGRELFAVFRQEVGPAENGATIFELS